MTIQVNITVRALWLLVRNIQTLYKRIIIIIATVLYHRSVLAELTTW